MFETIYPSPFGPIYLQADHDALLRLHFLDPAPDADILVRPVTHPILSLTISWLNQYFSAEAEAEAEAKPQTKAITKTQPRPHLAQVPPLRLDVTPFTRRVLEIAQRVPFGATITYGEIAEIIAAERNLTKMSARAVGSAMRQNPICLIIPCHRVIAAGNHLGGYSGHPDRKRQLLAHEGIDVAKLML